MKEGRDKSSVAGWYELGGVCFVKSLELDCHCFISNYKMTKSGMNKRQYLSEIALMRVREGHVCSLFRKSQIKRNEYSNLTSLPFA
jgi:hypothetical protein